MTLSPWIIYFWGIADDAKHAMIVAAVLSTLAAYVLIAVRLILSNEKLMKPGVRTAIVSVIFFLLSVATPSSKTIAVMVVAPAIVNSEPIQKDLPELYKAAKEALMSTLAK